MVRFPSSAPAEANGTARHRHVLAMAKVGVVGFGGGSALIPVMEKELVSPGALSEAEFTQDTVIANITPGALPVKLAALSGIRLGSPAKAVLGALAVAAPGALATVALLAAFSGLGDGAVRAVEAASVGIAAFILYLLAHYVVKVLAPGGRVSRTAVAIGVLAFLLTGADKVSSLACDLVGLEPSFRLPELAALQLVLLALVGIAVVTVWQSRSGRPARTDLVGTGASVGGTAWRSVGWLAGLVLAGGVVMAVLTPAGDSLPFLGLVLASTLSSFGGGEAYVGVADGFFVVPGIVDSATFYGQIVPIANALPGPILVKVAAAIAFSVGSQWGPQAGWAGALAALLVTVGSCSVVAAAVLAGYDRIRESRLVRNISAGIPPVICGLLASTAVSMLHANARIAAGVGGSAPVVVGGTVALAALVPAIHRLARVPDILLIGAFGLLSLLALGL